MTDAKKRLTRFDRLLRLRQQSLLQVEQKLAQLWQEQLAEQAELNRLTTALDEVMDSPVVSSHTSHATAWESKSRSAHRLRRTIQAQQGILDEVHDRRQQLRLKYTKLKAKAQSLELLLEKHGEQLRAETLKSDQTELDDMMLSRRHSEHVGLDFRRCHEATNHVHHHLCRSICRRACDVVVLHAPAADTD